MDVRDMDGNPGIWEKLRWSELSNKEKELWALLGWNQYLWDRNEAPPSANKAWRDLNYHEQYAAQGLGFSEEMWDGFEDE
ncbi:MAG: hypothetical protein HXX11_12440 [Desulfuromonadales bacterium]|nr:hypothetical protein [Desulfuromonadales bacterium]